MFRFVLLNPTLWQETLFFVVLRASHVDVDHVRTDLVVSWRGFFLVLKHLLRRSHLWPHLPLLLRQRRSLRLQVASSGLFKVLPACPCLSFPTLARVLFQLTCWRLVSVVFSISLLSSSVSPPDNKTWKASPPSAGEDKVAPPAGTSFLKC